MPFQCITDFVFFETSVEKSDIILVPGGSNPEKQMEKAAELFHQGMAPFVLPSGGHNPRLKETEYHYMKRIGVESRIPETSFIIEDQARNTFDNARNSWSAIQIANLKVSKAIMVCKAHHARRALMTYQTVFPLNIQMFVVGVENRGIGKDNWFLDEEKIQRVMTEVEKIGKYFGRHIPGWIEAKK